MEKRNVNKARNDIVKGGNSALLDKWRSHAAGGTASAGTIEFLENLDTPCADNVIRDCLGKCGGSAIEDDTGSCCEPIEMVGGSCFKDDDDPCPEGSVSDDLGTCCAQSELKEVGVGTRYEASGEEITNRTFVCGGENQKYYAGKAIGDSGTYCYPESYDFIHPKEGFEDAGTFNSYNECAQFTSS